VEKRLAPAGCKRQEVEVRIEEHLPVCTFCSDFYDPL